MRTWRFTMKAVRKYVTMVCYVGRMQFALLHELAQEQRRVTGEGSVSALVRDALAQYIRNLEDIQDINNIRAKRLDQALDRRTRAQLAASKGEQA